MRIDSSTIGMESARSYRSSSMSVRRFDITDYQGRKAQDNEKLEASKDNNTSFIDEWKEFIGISNAREKINTNTKEVDISSTIRDLSFRYIFDILFKAKFSYKERLEELKAITQNPIEVRTIHYTQETYFKESESTAFSTVGTVKTSDGREINFNVDVKMSRTFEEYYKEDLQMEEVVMCDPLVINLDRDVAELENQTFYFDIDADGVEDEIAQLSTKSGYLALDKNEDGAINDGNELFGAKSGNGFADLASFDEDGNGWIDENDSIWNKLKIWTRDENGNAILYQLAQKGVGAICLLNADTDFALKNEEATKGMIRKTGIFLYESGEVGTIQHVDLNKSYMEV